MAKKGKNTYDMCHCSKKTARLMESFSGNILSGHRGDHLKQRGDHLMNMWNRQGRLFGLVTSIILECVRQ